MEPQHLPSPGLLLRPLARGGRGQVLSLASPAQRFPSSPACTVTRTDSGASLCPRTQPGALPWAQIHNSHQGQRSRSLTKLAQHGADLGSAPRVSPSGSSKCLSCRPSSMPPPSGSLPRHPSPNEWLPICSQLCYAFKPLKSSLGRQGMATLQCPLLSQCGR